MQNENIKKTINEKELETLNFWNENKIFEKSVSNPAGIGLENGVSNNGNISEEKDAKKEEIKSFSFYDGPPFATGLPHHGHILAGTIKDVMPRYKTMTGHSVRRVWGWDCHGLPIENLIEKELNLNSKKEIEEMGIGKFTKACADSVLRYDTEWKKIVPRLGRWVDMDNAYKTMDWTYTESIWWAWKNLYEKKLAYEGYKIMHICPRCETPLAQSEVGLEYHDITDMTVTVKFELQNKKYNDKNVNVLAWTTTPWTLPGNTALAVNKNIEYILIEASSALQKEGEVTQMTHQYFVISKKIFESQAVDDPYGKGKLYKGWICNKVQDINISEYIGENYKPVFNTFNNEKFLNGLENSENIWKIWHADFITDESGTGIAHEAPAFGSEDMELAKENKIPVIKHVLMNGHFVNDIEENISELKGLVVKKKDDSISTDIEIVKLLAHSDKLFSKEKIVHSYPLCWRCKTPLLNYATSSWFVDIPKIKNKLISENQTVKWIPDHTRDGRFGKWLEGAREWAVSRKRYWGAPLPIWKSEKTEEIFVAGSLKEVIDRNIEKYKNNYTIIRHGEAKSNVENYYDEGDDLENHLTERGIEQVKLSSEKLKEKNIDLIIYSPILRTAETAKLISEILEIRDIFEEDNLRESKEKNSVDVTGYVQNRMQGVVEDLEKKYEGKNILIVTHMSPARGLFKQNGTSSLNLMNAEFQDLPKGKLPRDETGAINLHRPHIDKVILKDSEGNDMKLIGDVFDCWFESGSMPFAQLHYPFENVDTFQNNFPADFIAEGVDQTRGWFYSLINLGVGLFDKVPFKHVIVNGHIMAAGGVKMSKSLNNYTDPMVLVEKYGADALRFALVNSPAMRGEQLEMPDSLVEEVYKKNISRLENVFDFYKTYSENMENLKAKKDSNNILDKWILIRLQELINQHVIGFENYKLDESVKGVDKFIDDFSTWYLRRSRDRLKVDLSDISENTELEKGDKVQALETMKSVFLDFSKTIAPVMPFLADRLYREVQDKNIAENNSSVHLQRYTEQKEITVEDKKIIEEMKEVREVVAEMLMIRQKNNTPVKQPLLSVKINKNIDSKYFEIIKEELNIKNISIDTNLTECEIEFALNEDLIREGKQRELSREIKDKRKELGLVSSDFISLNIEEGRLELVDEEYKKEMKIKSVKTGGEFEIAKTD
jgi:isoleucyl-tRNA synthetase